MHDYREILTAVIAFLEERSRGPVVWGESDCTAWSAAWVEHITGHSLALPTWHSREEANALITAAGSLADLWSDAIDSNDESDIREGFGEPNAGDVGVIHTHLCGQVGGIFLNHRNFAWRGEQAGFRIMRPRLNAIVKFWRVP